MNIIKNINDLVFSENSKNSTNSKNLPYIKEFTIEERCRESKRVIDKYNDRVPVICEKSIYSNLPDIDKKKYLVPIDLTIGQFLYVIRKRINISSDQALFVFVNNTVPTTGALLSQVYKENKDEDGFLYFTYTGESVFGGYVNH